MTRAPWQDLAEYMSKTFIVTSVIYWIVWTICHKIERVIEKRKERLHERA